jgi:hypothetical protein
MLRQTEAAQPKRRPVFPEEHWGLLLPDASLGLGLDEQALDAASRPGAGWQVNSIINLSISHIKKC